MSYRVEFTPRAAKELAAVPPPFQKRIALRIDALAAEPRPRSAKKLAGSDDLYRIRVGDYRVIYQVADRVVLVTVIRIGHRRDIYR